MDLHLPVYPIAMLLVLIRFGTLVGMTMIFGRQLISPRVRIAIAMALSWFAATRLPPEWLDSCLRITDGVSLTVALAGEILLGGAMGLVCDLFVAVLFMTGEVLGREASLSMAKVMDPASQNDATVISTMLTLVFSLLVLLWDGHLFMIRLVMQSFGTLPPGFLWLKPDLVEMFTTLGGDVFEWGVRYALPSIVGGMIIAAAMGLMAKMAPEFNVLFLSLPIRLAMGVLLFAAFVLYGHDPLFRLFESMLEHLQYLLQRGA